MGFGLVIGFIGLLYNSWLHFFHSSMALQPFVGPWPLLHFHKHFTQSVGLHGWVISPSQGLYLHRVQHKHRINVHTDIHALSGIRTHDPSVRANEDISCRRPRSHCDRHNSWLHLTNHYHYQTSVHGHVFTSPCLVAASNGGHSPSSGFPNYSRASATRF
jgi:hypothetical protein